MVHPDEVVTSVEACKLLGITRSTLHSWIKEGKLKPWKNLGPGSTLLFLRGALAHTSHKKHLKEDPRRGSDSTRAHSLASHIVLFSHDAIAKKQISSALQGHGYAVSLAENVNQVKSFIKKQVPEIIILDLDTHMTRLTGWQIFSSIQKATRGLPPPIYLILSGNHTSPDVIAKALKMGAWDFLTKPIAPSVFVARFRLALRRRFWTELDTSPSDFTLTSKDGCLALDPARRTVEIRDTSKHPVIRPLTRKESDILCLFLKRPGLMLNKSMLLELIWGYSENIKTRTVDCHIKNLRHKLYPYGQRIETHYGLGYRFVNGAQTASLLMRATSSVGVYGLRR